MMVILREVLDTLHDDRVKFISIMENDGKTYLVNAKYAVYCSPFVLKVRMPDKTLNRAVHSYILRDDEKHALVILE